MHGAHCGNDAGNAVVFHAGDDAPDIFIPCRILIDNNGRLGVVQRNAFLLHLSKQFVFGGDGLFVGVCATARAVRRREKTVSIAIGANADIGISAHG